MEFFAAKHTPKHDNLSLMRHLMHCLLQCYAQSMHGPPVKHVRQHSKSARWTVARRHQTHQNMPYLIAILSVLCATYWSGCKTQYLLDFQSVASWNGVWVLLLLWKQCVFLYCMYIIIKMMVVGMARLNTLSYYVLAWSYPLCWVRFCDGIRPNCDSSHWGAFGLPVWLVVPELASLAS